MNCVLREEKKKDNPATNIKFNWILVRSQPLQPLNKKLYKCQIRETIVKLQQLLLYKAVDMEWKQELPHL